MNDINQAQRMDHIPFSGVRKVFEQVNQLTENGKDIINLSIGRPDFDTPTHIKEAAKKALDDGVVHYTSNYGLPGLIEALQEKFKKENNLNYESGEIIVTVGANEAVSLAMFGFLNKDDEVLIPDPSWLHYFYCAELAGAKAVSYPISEENHFNIQLEELEKLITPKTKMLIVNTPHNPTGNVVNKETLTGLAAIAKKHNLLVLSDEIYEKIIFDNQEHISIASLPGMRERTITLSGFSKAYSMTGWRIGYLGAPKALIDPMIRVHQYTVTCATSFAQKGAEAALREPQDSVDQMVTAFRERRDLVVSRIETMKYIHLVTPPEGAFYAFVNIKELGMSAQDAATYFLQEANVAMIPGSAFGKNGEGYLRIAFSNSYENINRALDQMEVAIDKLI